MHQGAKLLGLVNSATTTLAMLRQKRWVNQLNLSTTRCGNFFASNALSHPKCCGTDTQHSMKQKGRRSRTTINRQLSSTSI